MDKIYAVVIPDSEQPNCPDCRYFYSDFEKAKQEAINLMKEHEKYRWNSSTYANSIEEWLDMSYAWSCAVAEIDLTKDKASPNVIWIPAKED